MNAVDTNIIIYGFDLRDPKKHASARLLVQTMPQGVLVWQVACEFVAVSQRLAVQGVVTYDPWAELRSLRTMWTPVLPKFSAFARAEQLRTRFSLSFWDSMLIAVCLESGVQRLYSEDFSAYQKVDTLEIVNPFLP
ncbi:MAG: PIN domain-containing protein [Pirellulaceae bacterium]